jgi:solute carrier family 35 protein E1
VSWRVALTLVPTVLGVALSAWADTEFAWEGFIAAWLSTISQALMNVTSKAAIAKSGLSGQRSQFVLVTIASALMLLADVAFGFVNWRSIRNKLESSERARLVFGLAALAYHIEYVLNFIVAANVSEVHFSVLDVARRLAIILMGAFLFGKLLSPLNVFGVVLALAGVFAFNETRRRETAKILEDKSLEKKSS